MSINATLIGQMITFSLLVWFTMKYIWPPLFDALEQRKKKIVEGLAAAEKGQEEIIRAEKIAINEIKAAKEQSAEIVNMAQKRANEIVEESKENAKKEGERLVLAAKAQIEQEIQQAKEALRKEVATLALSAAEQILGEPVTSGRLFYCTQRGSYKEYTVTAKPIARLNLQEVIDTIDGAVAAGFLPAAPAKEACSLCDYQAVCGPREEERLKRKPVDRLERLEHLRGLP